MHVLRADANPSSRQVAATSAIAVNGGMTKGARPGRSDARRLQPSRRRRVPAARVLFIFQLVPIQGIFTALPHARLPYFASILPIASTLPADGTLRRIELRRQPDVDDRLGQFRSDDAGTHGDDLGVVRFGGAVGRIGIVGQRRANSGDLVGRNANADTRSTKQNGALVFTCND